MLVNATVLNVIAFMGSLRLCGRSGADGVNLTDRGCGDLRGLSINDAHVDVKALQNRSQSRSVFRRQGHGNRRDVYKGHVGSHWTGRINAIHSVHFARALLILEVDSSGEVCAMLTSVALHR